MRYPVSYRDLQEILAERGIAVDHATLNRWVVRYSPQIATHTHMRKRRTANSWRVDETCIKVRGKWAYLTGRLTAMAKRLISCCPSAAICRQRDGSSGRPSQPTAFLTGL
jgi:transposase-like protein